MMNAYGEQAVIRATFEEASEALGQDLWSLAAQGPAEAQALTINTQPLMLTAGVAVWRAWRALGGPLPAYVAGHSLGEYSALVAAEVLDFADAARLVRLRACAMQEAVPAGKGAMAAVLGLDEASVRQACAQACAGAAPGEVVEPANLNAPGQIVIAGAAAAVARAIEAAKALGAKRAVLLPVSAPFHCSLMKPAGEKLAEALSSVRIGKPVLPVLHNVDLKTHETPEGIRSALVEQTFRPVRWIETIGALAGAGVEQIFECGPGKVLAAMTKRISPEIEGAGLVDLATIEQAIGQVLTTEGKAPSQTVS
jgi:[acyl-carrier-protein] S-malonyltransferase